MNRLYTDKNECTINNRCKKYRICEHCNRARQARLCDITELASRFSPVSTYAVVMPFGGGQDEETVKSLKTKIGRKLKKSVNGAFCSIETSANDALHLNLILNSEQIITPEPIQKVVSSLGIQADIFIEQIKSSDIRKVTAYSLKRQSLPTKERYSGNLYNLTGNLRTAKNAMQSARMFRTAPAVAMVAMCKTLVDWGLTPPDNDLLQSTTFLKIAESLQFMVAQLKEFDACYSKKYGLLNSAEFEAIYRQKMKVIKMKVTKAKGGIKKASKKEKWTTYRLPKGQSLSEQEYFIKDQEKK